MSNATIGAALPDPCVQHDALASDWTVGNPPPRTYKKPHDPIALMHYWHKTNMIETLLGMSPTNYDYARLLDGDLLYQTSDNVDAYTPDEESIQEALKIREYYKLKIAHRTFTSDFPISDYYRELSTLLDMEVGTFLHTHIGILTTLLRIYDEDISYDKLQDQYVSFDHSDDMIIVDTKTTVENLAFVKEIRLNRLGRKQRLCCFKDDDNHLYTIMFEAGNALSPFIDRLCKETFSVHGYVTHVPLYPYSEFLAGKFHSYEIL